MDTLLTRSKNTLKLLVMVANKVASVNSISDIISSSILY